MASVGHVDSFEEVWGGRCYFQAYQFVENGADLQQVLDKEREAHRTTRKAPTSDPVIWARHATWAKVLVAGIAALYFIGFEASRWQATPGKRLLGLQVQSEQGGRLELARTALRFFAGSLSWLSLNLGHALAGWRKDGRALHDLLAGARV